MKYLSVTCLFGILGSASSVLSAEPPPSSTVSIGFERRSDFFECLPRDRARLMYRGKIEYASFGSMYDHDTSITGPAYRALYPNLPAPSVGEIVDSMSHFGMFRSEGTARPGWAEFKRGVAKVLWATMICSGRWHQQLQELGAVLPQPGSC